MFRPARNLAAMAVVTISLFGATEARAADCPHSHAAAAAHANRADVMHATVCLINGVRRAHGLPSLRLNARLSRAARGHSRDMVRRRYFAHYTPEGLSPAHRVRGTGYLSGHRSWLVGETLAWWHAPATPAAIVKGWMHSPPHREILLHGAYRDVGIGVALGIPRPVGDRGATYTADFGVRW
jgi:uncharacterized protein YkwD